MKLSESQFLLPGFVDTHIHAPQYTNVGLGLDKTLLEWLEVYTFPTETEYKDDKFAEEVYEKVVVSKFLFILLGNIYKICNIIVRALFSL